MDVKIRVTNRKIKNKNIINKTMERVRKGKMKYKEVKVHICQIEEVNGDFIS